MHENIIKKYDLKKVDEVAEIMGVCRATIFNWVRDKKHDFPKPIKLSTNSTYWKASDIEAYIEKLFGGTDDTK